MLIIPLEIYFIKKLIFILFLFLKIKKKKFKIIKILGRR